MTVFLLFLEPSFPGSHRLRHLFSKKQFFNRVINFKWQAGVISCNFPAFKKAWFDGFDPSKLVREPTLHNSHWSPAASPTGVSNKTPHLSRLPAEWRLESAGWKARCRARWRSPTLPGVDKTGKSGRRNRQRWKYRSQKCLWGKRGFTDIMTAEGCDTFPEVFTPFQRLKYTMVKMRKRHSINCQRTPPTFLSPEDSWISRTFLLRR